MQISEANIHPSQCCVQMPPSSRMCHLFSFFCEQPTNQPAKHILRKPPNDPASIRLLVCALSLCACLPLSF